MISIFQVPSFFQLILMAWVSIQKASSHPTMEIARRLRFVDTKHVLPKLWISKHVFPKTCISIQTMLMHPNSTIGTRPQWTKLKHVLRNPNLSIRQQLFVPQNARRKIHNAILRWRRSNACSLIHRPWQQRNLKSRSICRRRRLTLKPRLHTVFTQSRCLANMLL